MRRSKKIMTIAALLSVVVQHIITEGNQCLANDQEELIKAIKTYFEAEKRRDMQSTWEMLAPSSAFKRAYSYPFYEEMVRRNNVVVKDYQIEQIIQISDNPDPSNMPAVEKVAIVKVMVILGVSEGKDYRHESIMTFLREAGVWYKG